LCDYNIISTVDLSKKNKSSLSTSCLIELINSSTFIIIRNDPKFYDRFSGAMSLAISHRTPIICPKQSDEEDLPKISFVSFYCEVVDRLNKMKIEDYKKEIDKIDDFATKSAIKNKEFFKNNKMNLIFYKHNEEFGNFGDELSKVVLKHLLNKYSINMSLTFNAKEQSCNICLIGSYIQVANNEYKNVNIIGSGIRTEHDVLKKNNMKIYSVRGPLTKLYLEKYGYSCPEVFGDPALLLPTFYTPSKVGVCTGKIGIIGHISNFKKYLKTPKNFILIYPTWKWTKVIDYIYSCDLILSSSLHGLILADAYKIPNIWLDEFPLDEGHFKFKDYFASQNRKIHSINSINDFNTLIPYSEGNKINLNNVERAFENMCFDLQSIIFHGDKKRSNRFWLYPKNRILQNSWDTHNLNNYCHNYRYCHTSDTGVEEYECLGCKK